MLQAQGGAACKSEGVWCAINASMMDEAEARSE